MAEECVLRLQKPLTELEGKKSGNTSGINVEEYLTADDDLMVFEGVAEEDKNFVCDFCPNSLTKWRMMMIQIELCKSINKYKRAVFMFNPLTPSGPQNLTTFVYGGFVDIWIREMDSSAFSLFLLTVGGRKITGA
ncbi:hypothetical protein AVEN_126603-1 [Araneus ventricosus]|uniref:Uncharacterized protein n=1 Tax=Araneus ventricosus TaxID=182803 RepID=A0A4Y2SXV7_ARAVE|nr:hypothetical protein AVEN_126603-1 [Araneus ventricosus]